MFECPRVLMTALPFIFIEVRALKDSEKFDLHSEAGILYFDAFYFGNRWVYWFEMDL